MKQFIGKTLPSLTRFVDLKEWVDVDKRKPRKGQKVWICDADSWGWADYELPATYDGKNFIGDNFGPYQGMSYWKPRNERR